MGKREHIAHTDVLSTCLDAATDLIAFNMLAKTCPSKKTDEDAVETQYREFCEAIHGERLVAIGVLLEHRSECVARLEQNRIDSGCFFELELPVNYAKFADADKIAGVFERVWVQLNRLRAIDTFADVPAKTQKRSVGRPRPTEAQIKADTKIFEAWETKQYRIYRELASMLGKPEQDVRRAIDRYRKRVDRARK